MFYFNLSVGNAFGIQATNCWLTLGTYQMESETKPNRDIQNPHNIATAVMMNVPLTRNSCFFLLYSKAYLKRKGNGVFFIILESAAAVVFTVLGIQSPHRFAAFNFQDTEKERRRNSGKLFSGSNTE
jgi:hypothetical protein